jgi:DNA-directed RNA polymerase subunit RPC12/RpoP
MRFSKEERKLYARVFGEEPKPNEPMHTIQCCTCGFHWLMPDTYFRKIPLDSIKCDICGSQRLNITTHIQPRKLGYASFRIPVQCQECGEKWSINRDYAQNHQLYCTECGSRNVIYLNVKDDPRAKQ